MGTDCAIIAKLKTGNYKGRSLDRYYVFNEDIKGNELPEGEQTYQVFLNCLQERKTLLYNLTDQEFEKETMQDPLNKSYYLAWIETAEVFLITKLESTIEWVGIFDEHSDIYDSIWLGDKNIIIDKI
jgi:hypothetical protein